jgi:hypothetical protein
VLAAMTAAVAAGQALAFLDRAGAAAAGLGTANGTLELVLPGWQWRRRTWRPHPECRCGAARRAAGAGAQPVTAASPGPVRHALRGRGPPQ